MDHQAKRKLSFGINSAFITVVVLCLIGLINFLGTRYPQKLDTTKNKLHTFSDQTTKVMANLKSDLQATFYGDFGAREKYKPIFNNYQKLSTKFKLETIDPNKEPTRAKQAGIKKMDTLVLHYDGKTAKIEDISEEKITNELIKLTSSKHNMVCATLGHGEKSFMDQGAEGFSSAKKGLDDQSYGFKEINLPLDQKIPEDCSTVVMMSASKALFPAETKELSRYLAQGGRFVVGVDASLTQGDQTQELKNLLKTWGIEVKPGLIIDPVSRKLGVDASVPIIAQFNSEQTLTKDFKDQCYFPFSRPIQLTTPAPENLTTAWLAKTTPMAWGEMDLASISKGAVQFNKGVDLQGPVDVAALAKGKKDGKNETRIVVFGSGTFANNNYSRFGGNLDFFLNAISWSLEDESMITIRTKEDDVGTVELSQSQGTMIFVVTVLALPILIAALGIIIWWRRKKL